MYNIRNCLQLLLIKSIKMLNKFKKAIFYVREGFTLTELLIVTAVMMTLSGFGISSYVSFNERQVLEQAGKTLKNNLRLVQSNAVSGRVWEEGDPECSGKYLTGWCFSPQGDKESYSLYGGCAPDPVPMTAVNTFNVRNTSLPKGIIIKAYDAAGVEIGTDYNKILFKTAADDRVNIYTNGGGSTPNLTYCLKSANIPILVNSAYKISITSGGDIQDYGIVPSRSCP